MYPKSNNVTISTATTLAQSSSWLLFCCYSSPLTGPPLLPLPLRIYPQQHQEGSCYSLYHIMRVLCSKPPVTACPLRVKAQGLQMTCKAPQSFPATPSVLPALTIPQVHLPLLFLSKAGTSFLRAPGLSLPSPWGALSPDIHVTLPQPIPYLSSDVTFSLRSVLTLWTHNVPSTKLATSSLY